MAAGIDNTVTATQTGASLPALVACVRLSNRDSISNRYTPIISLQPNLLKTNEKRFSNRNCLLRLDSVLRIEIAGAHPLPSPRGGDWLRAIARFLPSASSAAAFARGGSTSKKRSLTRYTYRVRKGLFSLTINNITKNYSIHFWHILIPDFRPNFSVAKLVRQTAPETATRKCSAVIRFLRVSDGRSAMPRRIP